MVALLLGLLLLSPLPTSQEVKGDKRVVCYYTNWSVYRPGTAKFTPQNINPYLCTHLIYAFGGLDRENGLKPYDKYQDIEQGGYAKFTGLKTYNKNLKTLLAVGGWNEGSTRFSPLVGDAERRHQFVRNVLKFLRQNHFDGLDLDWEYPAFRDGGKPKDRENYAQLVQELREEFERESSKTGRTRLLLTMAVPAGIEYIDKGYDIPKLNKYLDFMNLLTYDYHSAFEPSVNHHSPLYSLEEESEYNFDAQLNIDTTIKHYLMKGAEPDKLVLGIPTYGRSYTLFNPNSTEIGSPSDGPGEQGTATREKGYLSYYEICGSVKAEKWEVRQPKETAMGPYAYKDSQWVGYDDESIVKKKAKYVIENKLGGIMFWSIDNDDFRGSCHSRPYPLIEAGKASLLGTTGTSRSNTNKLPSNIRGEKTGKGNKLKARPTTTTKSTKGVPSSTPEPPTTPDPGSDFICKEEGFFPHPRDCKKYFWCLDSGPSNLGIVAHQFTCPSGLYFNKAADSCDFSRNVLCNKKKTTVSTSYSTSTAKSALKYTTTTTTTTTTAPEPVEEEELEDDEDYLEDHSEEDPETIKQLIALIKKLGGLAELEKQLEGTTGSDTTSSPISKTLYDRVIANKSPRFQSFRNGPSGPQHEGLSKLRENSFKREKPQYVNIRRQRPSTTTTESSFQEEYEDEEEEKEEEVRFRVTYHRNRGSQTEGIQTTSERTRIAYQPINRFRLKNKEPGSNQNFRPTTPRYTDTSLIRSRTTTGLENEPTPSTSRYVTLRRERPYSKVEESKTENEVTDELVTEDIVPQTTSATTKLPRVKISTRIRRPISRRPIQRTTTTTTRVPETTPKERSTALLLRQRLNRYKYSRTTAQTTTESSSPQTSSPKLRKYEVQHTDSQLDASHEAVVSHGSKKEEDDISDLANVAVAALQSLATQPLPATTTPQYVETTQRTTKKIPISTTLTRSFSRGTPRPFSKTEERHYSTSAKTPKSQSSRSQVEDKRFRSSITDYDRGLSGRGRSQYTPPDLTARNLPRTSYLYDDYEDDYYAEPIDIPLSGKVRIHTDGYIECLDVGNFPHPFSCRKFISCAKMENNLLLGWEYTCPKGLSFDPIGSICNWNAGLGCKE